MRAPDKKGVWSAWRVHEGADKTPSPASLGCWLVHCPGAHAAWEYWMLSVVHLRQLEGLPPAELQYPEAAYELTSLALHPHPDYLPDPDNWRPRWLQPIDVCEQFHGVSDAQAAEILEGFVNMIVAGQLSPDSDYRSAWKQLLWETIEHMTTGHPRGNA